MRTNFNLSVYECSYLVNEANLFALEKIIAESKKPESLLNVLNPSSLNVFGTLSDELVDQEKGKSQIVYKVNYDEYYKFNYIKEPGGDGLELIDKDCLEKSGQVMKFLVKSLGKNFANGRDFSSLSLPVNIYDERSMLEL